MCSWSVVMRNCTTGRIADVNRLISSRQTKPFGWVASIDIILRARQLGWGKGTARVMCWYMQDNRITELEAIDTYGGNLTARANSLGFGSSRHASTNDWLHIRKEIIGLIRGEISFGYHVIVEVGISDVNKERYREQAFINEARRQLSKQQ